jgi:ATP-dependent helicase HrpA
VRFEDQSDASTLIKLMTDGILLAETQNDRYLERYDTIIVDEAHERSLNIDFLLGYLKTLLPRRPDLKNHHLGDHRPGALLQHFDDAPIVEVSGRTFPVETWYRPLTRSRTKTATASTTSRWIRRSSPPSMKSPPTSAVGKRPGDVLVFLPGEREIRDAADMLRKAHLATPRSCRCTRACRRPSSSGFSAHGRAPWCWPPTSPKPR